MIPIEYKRDMGRNYLTLKENIRLEQGYFLKLVENSPIEGILSLEVRTIDEKMEYYWDVTGKQSLKTVFERSGMSKEELRELLEKLWEVIKKGEGYLLKPEDYILTEDTIFLELSDFSLSLCYLPGWNVAMEEQWKTFTEYLMNVADHREEEMVLYVYSLYKEARQPGGLGEAAIRGVEKGRRQQSETEAVRVAEVEKPIYSARSEYTTQVVQSSPLMQLALREFKERIENEEIKEVYPKKLYWIAGTVAAFGAIAGVAGLLLWRPEPLQAGAYLLILCALCIYGISRIFSPQNKEARIEREVEFIPAEEKENTIFEWERQEEATMILAAEEPALQGVCLRAEDNGKYQDIELTEFPFFFGKLKTQVNSSIESPAVSRYHAKIEYLGGEYYLVDLNSTNGTYLNGEKLKPQERKKLEMMDKIRFADVGYYFVTV